jgi:hypothetical protein
MEHYKRYWSENHIHRLREDIQNPWAEDIRAYRNRYSDPAYVTALAEKRSKQFFDQVASFMIEYLERALLEHWTPEIEAARKRVNGTHSGKALLREIHAPVIGLTSHVLLDFEKQFGNPVGHVSATVEGWLHRKLFS